MYRFKKYRWILSALLLVILSYFLYSTISLHVEETSATVAVIHPLVTCRKVGEKFQPIEPTAIFYVDSPEIHSLIQFENLPKQSKLTAKWFYGSVDQKPLHITSVDISGSDTAHFWLQAPPNGWYIGNYTIEIYLNEEHIETREITITYK